MEKRPKIETVDDLFGEDGRIKWELMHDEMRRPYTQGIFLEMGYKPFAVYTLKDEHYEYKGQFYPSLKQLYMEFEDPIEYDFALKYVYNWHIWKRMGENNVVGGHIENWREEMELKIRSQAVKDIIDMTADERSFQAAKWLVSKGWETNPRGRPSEKKKETEKAFLKKVDEDYGADIARLREKT